MNEQRLRRSSWILLGAALCAQATSLFQHYDTMQIMIAVSAVLVTAGIYIHLRSKGYQPLKQWELYVFAILLYEIWFAAILITFLAMWCLSRMPQTAETSPRPAIVCHAAA